MPVNSHIGPCASLCQDYDAFHKLCGSVNVAVPGNTNGVFRFAWQNLGFRSQNAILLLLATKTGGGRSVHGLLRSPKLPCLPAGISISMTWFANVKVTHHVGMPQHGLSDGLRTSKWLSEFSS